jgi:hypothetical protein
MEAAQKMAGKGDAFGQVAVLSELKNLRGHRSHSLQIGICLV